MTFPILAHLPAVGLAELEERAALQSRVDRKYVLPVEDAGELLATLAPTSRVLDIEGCRHFTYESIYFDTPELISYRRTAHRHRRRFKIRTRTYVDSGLCVLEVKVPGPRGSTVKYRVPYEHGERDSVDGGTAFVDEILTRHGLGRRPPLRPTLTTAYLRCTLLLPQSDSRVTVDTDLSWTALSSPALSSPALSSPAPSSPTGAAHLRIPGTAVVETKTGSAASVADRLLWSRGHRPVAISKYATGLAALRGDLPAAPWRRLLRRHFTA
ncbi:polyphosphate polymerase domain-containing protein [Paractinoplanes rishiriensis]|uniref:VTC domain-containing protein n=1 Tax=Paractinoplanes rishiriensis TaxID=1050105 RepID=A0A919MUF3_9ACTN|nr:polyphosphate polymerase domain-containing protein [Actinoplanes rishiriensis]GIE95274.1 VTC domain-containing protein [Actinoplanes rishiriensis]